MNLYIALLHYPVKNKNGEVVSTAITNLDLHDMARTAKTYGVKGYYIINPMAAQRELAERIVRHWTEGFGAVYNPNRGEALRVIKIAPEFKDVFSEIERETGARPKVIATAARGRSTGSEAGRADDDGGGHPVESGRERAAQDSCGKRAISFERAREIINAGPVVIAFGTGWGLTDEFIGSCDYRLMPIRGADGHGGQSAGDGYNHLPVRSAAAIILDRLAGER